MVVFTCNHCGDSLHKPKVEKHYSFVCKTGKSLTCVDCLKDFRGEDYVAHTKCVTEEERYSAKGSIPGGIVKKGEVKQESWMEMLKKIVGREGLRPPIQNLLKTMLTYNNIPRKKPKFMNFMKNSSGGRVNMHDVEEVWNIIESYKNEKKAVESNGVQGESNIDLKEKSQEANKRDNNEVDTGETKSKKKKKKRDSSVAETNSNKEKPNGVHDDKNDEKHKEKKKKTKRSLIEGTEDGSNGVQDESNIDLKEKSKEANKSDNNEIDLKQNSIQDGTGETKSKKKKRDSLVAKTNSNKEIPNGIHDDKNEEKHKEKKKPKCSLVEETEDQSNIILNDDDATNIKEKKKKKRRSSAEKIEDTTNIECTEDGALKERTKKGSSVEDIISIITNKNGMVNEEKKKKKKHSLNEINYQDELNKTIIQNGDNLNEKNKSTDNEADETVPAKKLKMGTEKATFDLKENILTILTAKESIPLKKLEKKVLKAYKTFSGESECSPKVIKKFNKSLKRLDNIEINNDLVQLKK